MLSLYTSWGKTFGALHIAAALGQRTVIFVHKSQLLVQWMQETEKVLPAARVAVIQGTKRSVDDDVDIVIAMIQTVLNMDTFPAVFGFAIVDECHHIAAETFSTIFDKVTTKYAMGLSATVNRKDGLTKVLHHHLGPLVVDVQADTRDRVATVFVLDYDTAPSGRSPVERTAALVADEERNELITRTLLHMFHSDRDNLRKLLILSDRREHAAHFHKALTERQGSKTVGLYLGGMKNDALEAAKLKDVICSTYTMFGEGISVKQLNTLVMLTPKGDVCQVMGRIFRQTHAIRPWIVDIVDRTYEGKLRSRMKTYKGQLSEFRTVRCGLSNQMNWEAIDIRPPPRT